MLRTACIAAGIVALALGATACATPGPDATEPSGSPTASSTPSPTTGSVEPADADIPTECTDVVDPAEYAATFADMPLNDPTAVGDMRVGAVEPIASPPGSSADAILTDSARLICLWRDPDADITGLLLTIGTVDPAVARLRLDEMAADGYDCEPRLDGTQCQLARIEEAYGVEAAVTAFFRGTTWVLVNQTNVPTDDLVGALVARLWG
jgi:hypothetical protein